VVVAAADGRPIGLLGIADAPRETSPAVAALHQAGVEVVMLTGDNRAPPNASPASSASAG
jgi:P-type Cu2+ transporter